MLQFDRVKVVWGSDDMGFKTGTLISARRTCGEFVLPGHKLMAAMSHAAGRPYLLHACGKLTEIMDDLIDDVRIDAKHSFEDTIETVTDVKDTYGRRDRPAGRHRRGFPVPLRRGGRSARASARRSTHACPAAATAWAPATAWPTTSRWTTTWRCWTKGGSSQPAGRSRNQLSFARAGNMKKHLILGVHITNRVKHVPEVQKVLTEFGCSIKTRLGLHEAGRRPARPTA